MVYERSYEYLAGRLKTRLGDREMEQVRLAYEIASRAHEGQMRDEGSPYILHPLRVAVSLVDELDIVSPKLVCAALLHDVIEDSPVTREQIASMFGEEVAEIVWLLTKFEDVSLPSYLAAIEASTDPLVRYVLSIQAPARAVRSEWEDTVQAPTDRASARLADARFAVYGDSVYPDATLTLRLTYGRIEGSNVPGQRFAPFTTFAGLWDRATGAPPFDVAPKLLAAKPRIDPATVLDMTASTDTIGGSSGSPAVNAAGEIVGANFDSTVLTQRNAYGYDRDVNRSIIVTNAAITAVLRDVYGMHWLVQELGVR